MSEYIEREALLADFGEEPMVWTDSDYEIQERLDWYRYKGIVEMQPAAQGADHSKVYGEQPARASIGHALLELRERSTGQQRTRMPLEPLF